MKKASIAFLASAALLVATSASAQYVIGGHNETSESFTGAQWATINMTPGTVSCAVSGNHLLITEVAPRGLGTGTLSDSSEVVEIYNPTTQAVAPVALALGRLGLLLPHLRAGGLIVPVVVDDPTVRCGRFACGRALLAVAAFAGGVVAVGGLVERLAPAGGREHRGGAALDVRVRLHDEVGGCRDREVALAGVQRLGRQVQPDE